MDDSRPCTVSATALDGKHALFAILLLALGLRLIYLGSHSFWVDELFSLNFAKANVPDMLRQVTGFDNHPPVYYLLLHFWVALFGDSEASVRAPTVIFSVLSVLFTYKVGALLFEKRVAVLAALLLAVSSFSIYYAQEARMYGFLAFASVLSVYFFLRFMEDPKGRTLFNYVWATTVLVYSHLYGLFIIMAENVFLFSVFFIFSNSRFRVRLKDWLIAQTGIVVLSLPWFWMLANRLLEIGGENFWTEVPTLASIVKTFAAFSGTYHGAPAWLALMLLGMLSAPAARLPFAGKALLSRAAGEGVNIYLLSLLMLTPVVIPWVLSQLVTPIYIIRCTIAGHFAFYLLVAYGIMSLRARALRAVAVAVLLALSLKSIVTPGYVHGDAAQTGKLVDYMGDRLQEKDLILLCSTAHLNWPFRHYADKRGIADRIVKVEDNGSLPGQPTAETLWFVWRTDWPERCQWLPEALSDRYSMESETEDSFRHLGVTVFRRRPEIGSSLSQSCRSATRSACLKVPAIAVETVPSASSRTNNISISGLLEAKDR